MTWRERSYYVLSALLAELDHVRAAAGTKLYDEEIDRVERAVQRLLDRIGPPEGEYDLSRMADLCARAARMAVDKVAAHFASQGTARQTS